MQSARYARGGKNPARSFAGRPIEASAIPLPDPPEERTKRRGRMNHGTEICEAPSLSVFVQKTDVESAPPPSSLLAQPPATFGNANHARPVCNVTAASKIVPVSAQLRPRSRRHWIAADAGFAAASDRWLTHQNESGDVHDVAGGHAVERRPMHLPNTSARFIARGLAPPPEPLRPKMRGSIASSQLIRECLRSGWSAAYGGVFMLNAVRKFAASEALLAARKMARLSLFRTFSQDAI